MHPLEKKITDLVCQEQLITPGSGVILAVSGGPDSMAMLHLLAAGRRELFCTLTVTYVNHGLRPAREVEKEKRLVTEQASLLGLATRFGEAEVRVYARQRGLSIEDAGRRLRYAILQDIANRQGATVIAVAHTADDQAEEVLLRLLRGTGKKGLSGMLLLRDNRIVRPLLLTPKKELLSYLLDKKIPFAEDSTNANPRYLRNRIRHRLLPLLEKEYNPNIRQVLRNTAAILQDEEEYLEEHAVGVFKDCLIEREEGTELSTSFLNRQHPAIQRRIIEKVLWSLSTNPTFLAIEDIRRLSQGHAEGRELHLPRGLRVSREQDMLLFGFPKGKTPWRGSASKEPAPAKEESWGYHVRRPGTLTIDEIGRVVSLSLTGALPAETLRSEKDDFLDLASVSFPVICRSLRSGDRFRPLGAPGSKKVTDYLRDRKIPAKERRRIPVLECGGRIVALPGVSIAHDCRVRETTTTLLRISIR